MRPISTAWRRKKWQQETDTKCEIRTTNLTLSVIVTYVLELTIEKSLIDKPSFVQSDESYD